MEQRDTPAVHLKPLDRAQPSVLETATFATG